MRITITDDNRRKRRTKKAKKSYSWFKSWKEKKVADGTWKEPKNNGGK